jgi:phosphopantetheinyl transferase (holo-ACP synthase)
VRSVKNGPRGSPPPGISIAVVAAVWATRHCFLKSYGTGPQALLSRLLGIVEGVPSDLLPSR